jgi:hypothetical protein
MRTTILIILLAIANLAQANTQAELDELLGKQRQSPASHAQMNPPKRIVTIVRSSVCYYRVHYSIRGSGRNITVLAESSSEARRSVMNIFPTAVVTGVHKITG